MGNQSIKIAVLALAASLASAATQTAFADDATPAASSEAQVARHQRHAAMHQCVQTTLAGEGITLPPHVRGERLNLDAATLTKVKAARQTCWAQIKASSNANTGS